MKERRLTFKKAELIKLEDQSIAEKKKKKDFEDLVDNEKIRAIEIELRTRQTLEMQERQRAEKERLARFWRERRAQEAAEISRQRQAGERAAEQKRHETRNA